MARRSSVEWEALVAELLKRSTDLLFLEECPLAEERTVRQLAKERYSRRGLPLGHAIRQVLVETAVVVADTEHELGRHGFACFLVLYAQGKPIAHIARELKLARQHLQSEWRPRAIKLLTAELRARLADAEPVAA